MNIDYSRFYRGTANLPSYGGGAYKKDTLVKYEFNTKDEQGNKVMDQMSKEETLQAMKDIRSQYGDAVIVEFSGDGMAAFVNSKKGSTIPEDPEAMEATSGDCREPHSGSRLQGGGAAGAFGEAGNPRVWGCGDSGLYPAGPAVQDLLGVY